MINQALLNFQKDSWMDFCSLNEMDDLYQSQVQ